MKFKTIIVVLLVLLKINYTYSQNKISGKIVDKTNKSLPFANVVLYHSDTNKVVTGVISKDNGNYSFDDVPDGKYLLEISVLGFKTKKSDSFILSNKNNNISLNFALKEEAQELNEIVIKSSRPIIRQTAEKLVVDLENSEMASSNLQDVMKKIPGIIVTNGNITYAGQEGIRILINGNSTEYMDVSSLLRDLPADNIAKIELIQQPGAEFDAEGSGPLINIILKKNVRLGTNGNIKLYTGYDNDPEYNISSYVASYKNKLNWELGGGYGKYAWREDLFINRKVDNEEYDQSTISPYNPKTYRLNVGLDYYINDNNTFGVKSRYLNTNSDRIAYNSTKIINTSSSETLLTENSFNRNRKTYNISPHYKFENKKNKLTLNLNYVDYNNNNINNLYSTGQSSIPYDNQRYFQNSKYQIYAYKGDYKRTVSEDFNWMFGAKYSMVSTNSDLKSFTQNTNGNFIFNKGQSNRFFIDENILAAYLKVVKKWKYWSFSGGLRWEDSNTKGTSTNTGETKSRNISNFS